jgi:hypothetical protein
MSNHTLGEDEMIIRIDAHRFLELHYHRLLYTDRMTDQAHECIEGAANYAEDSATNRHMVHVGTRLKKSMAALALETKHQLQEALGDKPAVRSRFSREIAKCAVLIARLTNETLEWANESK